MVTHLFGSITTQPSLSFQMKSPDSTCHYALHGQLLFLVLLFFLIYIYIIKKDIFELVISATVPCYIYWSLCYCQFSNRFNYFLNYYNYFFGS